MLRSDRMPEIALLNLSAINKRYNLPKKSRRKVGHEFPSQLPDPFHLFIVTAVASNRVFGLINLPDHQILKKFRICMWLVNARSFQKSKLVQVILEHVFI